MTEPHSRCSPGIEPVRKIVCHAEGDRCLGCSHYRGLSDQCEFALPDVAAVAKASSGDESGCARKCVEANDSGGSGIDRNSEDTTQGDRPAAVVKVPSPEHCGSAALADRIEKAVVLSVIEPCYEGQALPAVSNPISDEHKALIVATLRSGGEAAIPSDGAIYAAVSQRSVTPEEDALLRQALIASTEKLYDIPNPAQQEPQPEETRHVTDADREYASELLADLTSDDLPRLEIAARWFRKARVEHSLGRRPSMASSTTSESSNG